jgi:hypothetical protein
MSRARRTNTRSHRATRTSPADFAHREVILEALGICGCPSWDSLSPGEYNPALVGNKAILTYDKMRRSDAQVAALEAIISLPVRAVKWSVKAAGEGRAEQEAAELIERNLLKGMAVTWDDFLRQMLLSVLLGFSVHEQIWVERDGYIQWEAFSDLPQTSVTEFHTFDHTWRPGIKQAAIGADGKWQEVTIPPEKLLVTTYRLEGRHYAGFPVLRQAYKHWFIKDSVYRIINLGIENNLLGTMIGSVPPGMSDPQRKKFLAMIEQLRARDITGFIKDADMDLALLEAQRNPIDVMPYIEHHDVQIVRTALAQFLNLGQTGQGTQALSDNHSRVFMLAEQTLSSGIAGNLNRGPIPQLCAYNWPGMSAYPEVYCEDPRTVLELDAIGYALAQLVSGQLITPDRPVEERVRELYGLPPLPDEQPAPKPQGSPRGAPSDTAPDDDQAKASVRLAPGPASCGHELPAAFASTDIAQVGQFFDQVEDSFQTEAGVLLDELIAQLERKAAPALARSADGGNPLSRASVYQVLAKVSLANPDRYVAIVRKYLEQLVIAGGEAAAQATGQGFQMSRELRVFLRAQAQLTADRHLADIKAVFIQQLLDGVVGQVEGKQAVSDAAQAARDRATAGFQGHFRAALLALTDHLGPELPSVS